jgi:hypothetical protein
MNARKILKRLNENLGLSKEEIIQKLGSKKEFRGATLKFTARGPLTPPLVELLVPGSDGNETDYLAMLISKHLLLASTGPRTGGYIYINPNYYDKVRSSYDMQYLIDLVLERLKPLKSYFPDLTVMSHERNPKDPTGYSINKTFRVNWSKY